MNGVAPTASSNFVALAVAAPPSALSELLRKRLPEDWKPAPNSRVKVAMQAGGVQRTSEFERILALPRRVLDLTAVPDLTEELATPAAACFGCLLCRNGPARLWPIQSAALHEARLMNGLFAPIAVGAGKTLISLLLPEVLDAELTVLLVPPQLRDQLLRTADVYRRHFRLRLDRIHVVAYSELSLAHRAESLEQLGPDLIVADEAHNLRRTEAARTKRFLRYMKMHPGCRFAAMSGTVTKRSIKDYAHLIELALKKNSPLPGKWSDLSDWADALDVFKTEVEESRRMRPGALQLLCVPGESVRAGYRRRLVESRGVVATDEGALGASLVVQKRNLAVPTAVLAKIDAVRKNWEIDGEELTDALEVWRIVRQLACGFYYVWDWPDGEPDAEWLEARRAWHREVRDFLHRRARAGMDSPLLLARAAAHTLDCEHGASGRACSRPHWLSETWSAWSDVKHRAPPPVKPVWLDDFMVDDVVKWAYERTPEDGGIVWYEHDALGRRVAEKGGLPFFGPGEEAGHKLGRTRAADRPAIVCSVHAHGTGKDLQEWRRNLVTTPPSAGAAWEQLLGRTHRPGQQADEVLVEVYLHVRELVATMAGALKDAAFIEETQGQRQKLLYADRVELPDLGMAAETVAEAECAAQTEMWRNVARRSGAACDDAVEGR